jgi:hypothetical protein
VPAFTELMISVGIVAAGLLVFRLAIEFLPVYAPAGEELEEPVEIPEVLVTTRPGEAAALQAQSILRH